MSIEVKNLFYKYGEKTPQEVQALENINFRIDDGEFVGIMGHTGCGKSTLIQLLAGLLAPSGGRIIVDDSDINDAHYDRSILRETVGVVFQYPEYQLFETTVEKDVAFALRHSGLKREEVKKRVKWALETMGFSYEDVKKKSPLSLSGGEKRRVAIAGVLAAKPKILIFDEPIAGLDPYGRKEFLELMVTLNQGGTTILMVSHNVDCICEYAHRVLVLNKGQLVADGAPEEVFRHTAFMEDQHIGMGNVQSIADSLYHKGVISSPVITKYENLLDVIRTSLKVGEGL